MFVKKLFHFLVILWISTVVVSCDKPGMPYPDGIMGDGSIEALVLNEGLINTNAGAISVIYKDGGVVVDAFQDVNHRPMGDVAQSITLINGKYFVAMNNSKKIEIIDPVTFKSVGTILYTQAGYPRQVVPISSTGGRRVRSESAIGAYPDGRTLRETVGVYFYSPVGGISGGGREQSIRDDTGRFVRV